MKVLNITHTDLDGIGCSLVLQMTFGKENVECHHTGYGKVDKRVQKALDRVRNNEVDMMFITDICFSKDSGLAEEIDEINKVHEEPVIRVFDHHATSRWINQYSWGSSYENINDEPENKVCGTMWTLFRLHSSGTISSYLYSCLFEFVSLVNDWDTWKWVTAYPEDAPNVKAKQLNMLLSIYGTEKFKEVFFEKLQNEIELFGKTEQLLLELKQNEIDEDVKSKNDNMTVIPYEYVTHHRNLSFIKDYVKSNNLQDMDYLMRPSYHKRFNVGVIFAERNISEVGNELGKLHPELDFIMIISLPNTVSFRTVNDLPVPLGIIANDMTRGHGGGHPKSAGGVLQPEYVNTVVRELTY